MQPSAQFLWNVVKYSRISQVNYNNLICILVSSKYTLAPRGGPFTAKKKIKTGWFFQNVYVEDGPLQKAGIIPGGLSIHVENSVTVSVLRLSDFIEKQHDTGEREYSVESYLSVLVH